MCKFVNENGRRYTTFDFKNEKKNNFYKIYLIFLYCKNEK